MTMHSLDSPVPLRGKVAVVTGAGRGIGRAIALGYAKAGAAVVCSARSDEGITETMRAIAQAGGTATSCVAGVVDLKAVQALFAHAAQVHGGVDIVVGNAGVNGANSTVRDSNPVDPGRPRSRSMWSAPSIPSMPQSRTCARGAAARSS
jgi:3-oxoacyl-[acyl-carrier protein] reductase